MCITNQFKSYQSYNRFKGLMAPHEVDLSVVIMAVYVSAIESVEGLIPGAQYTTEDLCGPIVWSQWPSKGQHRALGICLSFLVAERLVPLVRASPAHRRNKRYSMKLANT